MKENLFVLVTKTGNIFNRTGGKNSRIYFNKRMPLGKGYVEFTRKDDTTIVTRYSASGVSNYTKTLNEGKMYMIMPMFVQELKQESAEMKLIYNRLRTVFGKPNFKISVDEELKTPFRIKLQTWIEKGDFKHRFTVKVSSDNPCTDTVAKLMEVIKRTSELNLHALMTHFRAYTDNGLNVVIDDEFLDLAVMIEKIEKKKQLVLQ